MSNMSNRSGRSYLIFALFLLLAPCFVWADYGGEERSFFIDPAYDLKGRAQTTAILLRITPELYFYLDKPWWHSLNGTSQTNVKNALQDLGNEFGSYIYPKLAAVYGTEWRPGIDNDQHITVLLHPMKEQAGGYINTADEYSRLQNVFSNEREMLYLNSQYLTASLAKSYLAHEFVHLITFEQKERRLAKEEDVWLNELRADLAPTFLGYDDDYNSSNLKKRVNAFLTSPNNSLVEWQGKEEDYGVLNIFGQYLIEQYGWEILTSSMASAQTGIASLNEVLLGKGKQEIFNDVFTNWTIAVVLNDCTVSEKYCYQNVNLKKVKVVPEITFLPFGAESSLALTEETKNWAGNWFKVIGGIGTLKLDFAGFSDVDFRLPYILEKRSGEKEVKFLELSAFQSGKLALEDFNSEVVSLVIIPTVQDKLKGFIGLEKSYPFFWSVATQQNLVDENGEEGSSQTEEIKVLLEKIAFLEKQLTVLRTQLKEAMGEPVEPQEDEGRLTYNLGQGDSGEEVRLLQAWLAKDAAVYPEGLTTGYFGILTKAAVIRFQEKYSDEILSPWGLTKGTGFVGSTTRAKLNQLYSY